VGAVASYTTGQDPSHKGSGGGNEGPGGGRVPADGTTINVGVLATVAVVAEAELLPVEAITLAELAPFILIGTALVAVPLAGKALADVIPSSTNNTATNTSAHRGGKRNLSNEWVDHARRLFGNSREAMCNWLALQYQLAKGTDRLKIKAAQKFLGCRRSGLQK
jgi:hypothetical protein